MPEDKLDSNSFNYGVLAAFMALKAAIQGSPGFNQEALEKAARTLLDQPMTGLDHDAYSRPLNMLLSDQSDLLKRIGLGNGPKPRH